MSLDIWYSLHSSHLSRHRFVKENEVLLGLDSNDSHCAEGFTLSSMDSDDVVIVVVIVVVNIALVLVLIYLRLNY